MAAVFVLFVVSGAGARRSQPAPLIRVHRSRAGCLSANQAMPVQVRLSAPFSFNTAGASLRSSVSKTLRARGSTETLCHFSKLRESQVGRQRPHKPSMSGSIPAPATNFPGPLDHSGGHSPRKRERHARKRKSYKRGALLHSSRSCKARGTVSRPATNLHFSPLPPRRSTISKSARPPASRPIPILLLGGKVENQGSLISSPFVVRLHVPQPPLCGGSSLKTRAGL